MYKKKKNQVLKNYLELLEEENGGSMSRETVDKSEPSIEEIDISIVTSNDDLPSPTRTAFDLSLHFVRDRGFPKGGGGFLLEEIKFSPLVHLSCPIR